MSSLVAAAEVFTYCFGSISVLCIVGFFLLRHRTVFAVRCPEIVLGCMLSKFVGFCFVAWMFLDPECPCWAATVVYWLDWQAHYLLILGKVLLLFRFEIQAALEKNKQQGGALTWDLNNVYIKYRHILKTNYQIAVMVGLLVFVGVGHAILLIIFRKQALEPCLMDRIYFNKLYLYTVIVSWVHLPLLLGVSIWTSRRLRKFPKDNWQIGWESTIVTGWKMISVAIFFALCLGYPTNDATMFWLLVRGPIVLMGTFFIPLRLWRRTMQQTSSQELKKLATLSRLLREQVFLKAFDQFLKSEFSSENLYFWLEVDKMVTKYRSLMPPGFEATSSPGSPTRSMSKEETDDGQVGQSESQLALEFAADLIQLGRQCIGNEAPWQVNISGNTEKEMEAWIGRVNEKMKLEGEMKEHNLRALLEETWRALIVAQAEVYDCLRRDPYPRFLLTPACEALNNDARLKRLLAAEMLEGDVVKPDTPPQQVRGMGGSTHESSSKSESQESANRHARAGSSSGATKTKKRKSATDKESFGVKPQSKPFFEVTLPAPNAAWNKHVRHLTDAVRLENASMQSSSSLGIPSEGEELTRGSISGDESGASTPPITRPSTPQPPAVELTSLPVAADVVVDVAPVEKPSGAGVAS